MGTREFRQERAWGLRKSTEGDYVVAESDIGQVVCWDPVSGLKGASNHLTAQELKSIAALMMELYNE